MNMNGEAVKDQLERILASGEFRRSVKLSNFLRFTVDQALTGEPGSAKECLIGMHIFGRRPDYDPATDPIVRVEARRLRRKLASYYANGGRHDPLRIDVPKGAYRPVFESQSTAPDERHSIAVLPFSDRSAAHEFESLADGLTVRLIARLAVFQDLSVVSSTSVFQYKNRCVDARDIGRDLDVHLILEGSLRSDAGRFRCDTQLVSTADGKHRWAGSFDCGELDRFAVEDQFADVIARGVHAVTMTQ